MYAPTIGVESDELDYKNRSHIHIPGDTADTRVSSSEGKAGRETWKSLVETGRLFLRTPRQRAHSGRSPHPQAERIHFRHQLAARRCGALKQHASKHRSKI